MEQISLWQRILKSKIDRKVRSLIKKGYLSSSTGLELKPETKLALTEAGEEYLNKLRCKEAQKKNNRKMFK